MTYELTDSDILAAPGGEYAVLRRIRERVLAAAFTVSTATAAVSPVSFTPFTWTDLPPQRDPWARPDWDEDTVYLQLLVTTR